MKTSDFDLLFEVKEDFLNKAFAIAFYTSAIPTAANGTILISEKLPSEMKSLGNVDFEFRLLEPPSVDAMEKDSVRLLFNVQFSLSMMHGLYYEFDITLTIAAAPKLLQASEHLKLTFDEGKIDEIVFNDKSKFPFKTIKAIDEIIKAILKTHLLDKLKNIDLTPFLKKLSLPDPVEGIDTVLLWNNGKAFFFKGEMFLQYDTSLRKKDEGYPLPISQGWKGVWETGIDAAMIYDNGKVYFFKNEQYVRFDLVTNQPDPGYPKNIADGWEKVWKDGIDAAVTWNNGKAYFFKGHEYISYDIASDKTDDGYPKDIAGNWQGVWADGIDTVVLWNNGKSYFFKGDEYISYDVANNKADDGYPKKTIDDWQGVWLGKLPLPTKLSGFKMLNERVFTVGINLFDNQYGNINSVNDYTEGNDLWVGIREKTMHQIFDYVWANTATHLKRKHWGGTYDVIGSKALNYINTFSSILTSIVPNLLSTGVLESSKVAVDYLKCDASASVSVNKPEFDLSSGNNIEISNLQVRINLYLRVYTKITISETVDTSGWFPDILTPWEDDITTSSSTSFDLINLSYNPLVDLKELDTELIAELTKGILLKVRKFKIDLDLQVNLLDDILSWLINQLSALILPLIPPIRVLPPLVDKEITLKALNFSMNKNTLKLNVNDYVVPKNINIKIENAPVIIDDEEISFATKLSFDKMPRKTFSLPLFVANCNPKRMEVHRLDCNYVEKIDQAYRIGYYILNDALHDGFDGCKYCLPEYHRR